MLPRAIIADLDGTTCIKGDRGPFEWHKVHLDTPNPIVINFVQNMSLGGLWILWVSGRMDDCEDLSVSWLATHAPLHNPNKQAIFMRKSGDYRPDTVVKEEIYRNYIEHRYDVLMCTDDRTSVVDMWRDVVGLPVWQWEKHDL